MYFIDAESNLICFKLGFSSYNLYLDHLRSSPCGIQQQAANKPRVLDNQSWNTPQDKQRFKL